ncbi:class I SAM-dependent methyltransferase [Mesobaculum littorinae]|uniref:Class I SAM-dependent methyltransferase n=1 Tax=Mesobaculum littorinae TaxID=2486419 RepID=A0A438AIW5_9RHOB|nr:class I SAM-dependent methyltransferase [Mesobaculum littorinae]RVV98547.1 class I SAM-dependent methyltransferase [Mesobaculum littorinae]
MADAADGIIDLYRRHGAAWVAARGAVLTEGMWLDRFAGLLGARARVLDIGCGAGVPIARAIADRGHEVTGVASAPGMIALFRANLPGAAAYVADMRGLDLRARFDGLIAWDSFFHLDRDAQRTMFAIFHRHAAAGAPLLFTSGPAEGEVISTLEGEPLFHASLDPGEYRRLLDKAGFDVIAHVAEDPQCTGHTVWLARRR